MVFSILVTILIGVFAFYQWLKRNDPKNPPPGPSGLPFIGNAHQLDKRMYLTFDKWSKKFPIIYQVDILATTKIIVVSDHKIVKEMFASETYSGRAGSKMKWLDIHVDGGMHGLVNTEGEEWEQLRRFSIRQLRDYGFGKTSMESLIMEEVKELINWMKSQEGKSITGVKEKFVIAVVNSLWSIISGKRYSHDDPVLVDLTNRLQTALTNIAETGGLLLFAPWLRHIIPERSGFNYIRRVLNDLRVFFSAAVTEHQQTLQADEPRDFIDSFLNEINQSTGNKSAFSGKVGERQLIGCIADLFSAGTDTTSTTLSWIFLYLSTFPEVQKKLQKEIELTVGSTRYCTLADRLNMPYTEALIAEVMRCSSIVSMSVHHRALKPDAQFQGYTISQEAIVLANLHYIHHNPDVWGDPENFRPERFLSPDEKTFKKHDALMPFSIGKRQCLGESLAKDTLFLFATNIFQRFNLQLDPNEPNPGLEPAVGLMLNPKPYKVILTDRFE